MPGTLTKDGLVCARSIHADILNGLTHGSAIKRSVSFTILFGSAAITAVACRAKKPTQDETQAGHSPLLKSRFHSQKLSWGCPDLNELCEEVPRLRYECSHNVSRGFP